MTKVKKWVFISLVFGLFCVLISKETNPQMQENLRVVTYNILSSAFEQYHGYCPPEFRKWSYRQRVLVEQLKSWDADIISLQELNEKCAKRDLLPPLRTTYKAILSCGSRKGLGVFYKPEVLKAVHSEAHSFNNLWGDYYDAQRGEAIEPELISAIMEDRDDEALFIHFSHLVSNKSFVFVTTHLFHDPRRPEVKLLQTAVLLSKLEQFLSSRNLEISTPIIITGDLNSLPIKYLTDEFDTVQTPEGLISGVYELLSSGIVHTTHPHHPNTRELEKWKKKNHRNSKSYQPANFAYFGDMRHPFSLTSVCKAFFGEEPKVTTKTDSFQGTLDYVWVSDEFTVDRVLPIPQDTQPVPDKNHPSDHFPIISDLLL